MNAIRTGAIILGICFVLLVVVNLLSAAILDGKRHVYNRLFGTSPDTRAALPVYQDRQRAETLFREFRAMGFEYVSVLGWSRRPFAGETVTVGSDGDRQHPRTTDDPKGIVRFFGGSTMWGEGAEDAETIPALFNTLFPDYRVFNHAESGFTSRQALARLINLANQDAPMDLVIFYDGVNAVDTSCRDGVPLNGQFNESEIRQRVEIGTGVRSLRLTRLLADPMVELAGVVGGKIFAGPDQEALKASFRCHGRDGYADRVAGALIENWKIAKLIVEARGGHFIAILQPVSFVGAPTTDHLAFGNARPYMADDYRTLYARIQDKLAAARFPWAFDFTDAFDGPQRLYIDFAHVGAAGNQRIAARIKGIVDSRGLLAGTGSAAP